MDGITMPQDTTQTNTPPVVDPTQLRSEALSEIGMQSAETEAARSQYRSRFQDVLNRISSEESAFQKTQSGLMGEQSAIQTPSYSAPQIDPKHAQDMSSLMITMSLLGGAMTKRPMMAAMGNLEAMMKGQMAGHDGAAAEAKAQFDENMKMALEKSKLVQEKIKSAIETHKGDQAALRNEIYGITQEAGMDSKMATLLMQDPKASMSAATAIENAINKVSSLSAKLSHGAAALSKDQNDAVTSAIADGRLDPNRVNSRTASLLADILIKNPGIDLASESANIALARNPAFRQKALNIESLPDIMKNMVEAGKKLDFDSPNIVGRMQAWTKGQLSDPDMTYYMALRNDAVMLIASVMRGQGMTDMAHAAENEVTSPHMTPEQLDAWFRAQMTALGPRLKLTREITGRGANIKKSISIKKNMSPDEEKWVDEGMRRVSSGKITEEQLRATLKQHGFID